LQGNWLLYTVCQNGYEDLVQLLLLNGADVNIVSVRCVLKISIYSWLIGRLQSRDPLLHAAARSGKVSIVQKLVEAGVRADCLNRAVLMRVVVDTR
jgi:ankyrin repeat protein